MLLKIVSNVFHYSGGRSVVLIPAIVCSLLSSVLALSPAIAAFVVLQAVSTGKVDSQWCFVVGLLTAIAMVLRYVLALGSGLMSHKIGNVVATSLREAILEKVGRLGAGSLSSVSQGRMKKMLTEDVNQIDMFVSHHLPDLISAIVMPLGIGLTLFLIDWRMALAVLVPLPFAMWVQVGSGKIVQQDNFMATYGAAQERMNNTIIEFVRGMPVVKIFNRNHESCDKLSSSVAEYRDMQASFIKKLTGRWGTFLALVTLCHVPLGIFGLWMLSQGKIELAELVLFLMLGPMLFAPLIKMMRIGAILSQLNEIMAGMDALFAEEADDRQVCREQGGVRVEGNNTITVKDLCFSYGESQVLNGINMVIEPESLVAVVGLSGSGKSTLAALLAGMERPQFGSIHFGSRDMSDMSLEEISEAVSVFLQDSFVFTGSVRDNILLGCPDADMDSVVEAARTAQCHERILALPDGYDTVIGEGGQVQLSGGEKQRVVLARCILRDAPVLIMDEATAAMDAENESRIQQALSRFTKSKTVIVITHRINTVEKADHIVVLNKGCVSGQGSHTQLLKTDNTYAAMWNAHLAAKSWKIGTGIKEQEVVA
ncbi:ABC transporter ATP-binding protein [Maridesulfovibrio sp.]|uniref:ABC transporter ATP-binding protein n=1 Tax=Maridesulfovibrio sp. TaxID=2795000 RepID=UPI003BAD5B7B